jgi:hypothetical protein
MRTIHIYRCRDFLEKDSRIKQGEQTVKYRDTLSYCSKR